MRSPSSPGQGGASSPGNSFWIFWQNTIRGALMAPCYQSADLPRGVGNCSMRAVSSDAVDRMCAICNDLQAGSAVGGLLGRGTGLDTTDHCRAVAGEGA